ncbi:hypothetical protein QTP70_026424 [Hemibagrus guttatus]|uniref:Uncharacterized protein n=1 Tax=Hemibagrus guttatus TaxID=175788 RepID=A0AAE0USJ6_9TELE|nr:hypothetical protein QTP70_026424 [Hemibagrus guttatus]
MKWRRETRELTRELRVTWALGFGIVLQKGHYRCFIG